MSDLVPLPLDLVLSGRDLTEPRLSPDGDVIAFVTRWRGRCAVSVVDVHGRLPERILTYGPDPAPGRGLGGGCFAWMPEGEGIVHAAADGELWLVVGARLDRLTNLERTCRAPDIGVGDAGAVVAYAVDEAEVWITEIDTGVSRRLDDGRHEFCFDPVLSPDGVVVSWQGWSPPDMAWDGAERVDCRLDSGALTVWRPDDGAVQQPRFAPDGTPMCVHDASGWLNVHVGRRPLVSEPVEHAGPTWGMGQRSYVAVGDRIAYTRNVDGAGELWTSDLTSNATAIGVGHVYGQLSAVGGRLVALRSGPSTPSEIVVFDEVSPAPGEVIPEPRVVAVGGVDAWRTIVAPSPIPVVIDADGHALHARRYVAGEGRLLCWIHGGPTDQWQVEFRPRIEYWRSRGWDVLVVDPRGTTGHGRDHQRALNGAWGRLDVDDTAALIRHAHAAGWATAERTVVIGGSSGGLTVLGVLADHPDIVAGGVASYPVSDLADLATSSHRFEAHYTDTLVGPAGDAEQFAVLSPLHRADMIRGPLLVFHGSDDPVVPAAQSGLLVERIRASGGTVDHVVYEGEGHGFRDPDNQHDEYARTEAFLELIAPRI